MTNEQEKIITELKGLRWVEDATTDATNDMYLTTRPDSLNCKLTHKIQDMGRGYGARFDSRFRSGKALKTKITLKLPSYIVRLSAGNFSFRLKDKPEGTQAQIGIIPTYHYLVSIQEWESYSNVCYGESNGQKKNQTDTQTDYRAATSWREKAIIAVTYLQSAEPHYGYTWYRTAWAYRLGLVGDEFVEGKEKAAEPLVQEATTLVGGRTHARLLGLYNI